MRNRETAEQFAREIEERDGVRMRVEQETGLDGRTRWWPVADK